jgi:V8-like Glu-specific endopeptidase
MKPSSLTPLLIASTLLAGFIAPATARSENETAAETADRRSDPVIYGDDDRQDVFEVEDALLRERARRSVVALVFPHQLRYQSDGEVTLSSPTVDEIYQLCDGEAFQDQPAAAHCSGVLIDDDLVLTAGHCMGFSTGTVDAEAEAVCASTAFVFGYLFEAPGTLATITEDDVYRCGRIVVRNFSEDDMAAPDYTIIQLDRPVANGLEPVPIRTERVELGERVTVVGFGARLPAKVDQGGIVMETDRYDEYFGATTDTFEGASGSPVFNRDATLVALHTRGNEDWAVGSACTRAIVQEEGTDEHQYVDTPLGKLCELGWPSQRLCQVAPACDDGVCNAGETSADCPNDCTTPSCGNSNCEAGEAPDCEQDCNPYADVAPTWYCPAEYYGDRQGCDCGCGALDPDCARAEEELLGCNAGETCGANGQCISDKPEPAPRGCAVGSAARSVPEFETWGWLLALAGLLRRRAEKS